MSGRHFRDYHLLFDEEAEQVFAMTDDVAERARKIGGTTLRAIGEIARRQRLHDSDQENLAARSMVSELRDDNARLTGFLREAHEVCATHNDVASTSLIETWLIRRGGGPGFCRQSPKMSSDTGDGLPDPKEADTQLSRGAVMKRPEKDLEETKR